MPDVAGVTNYPASLDTDFTLLPVRDLESTTLDAPGVTSSSTVFPVIDTTGWPSAGFFTIEGEHCSYTGKTLTSYTGCSRGLFQSLGGVAPAAHATAATINLLVIAATHQVQNDAIRAIEAKVGVGASTPTNAKYLKGGATPGTSAWGDITSGEIAAALGFTPAPGITVQVGDVTLISSALTLDLDSAYLTATESPTGEANITWAAPPILSTSTLVLAAGVATLPAAKGTVSVISATIDTEAAAAADDLDQINATGSLPDGTILILKSLAGGRVSTVRHDPTKISLESGLSFALASTTHRLTLQRVGTVWVELSRQPTDLRIGATVQAWDADLDALAATPTNYLRLPGEVVMYGGAAAPSGWLLCDGGSYLRATYPALFAAIGTVFGAVDGTHFSVPDMRDRFVIGKGVATMSDTLGETGGVDTVTLSAGQSGLVGHTHAASSGTESAAHTHTYSDNWNTVVANASFATGAQAHSGVSGLTAISPQTGGESVAHSHAVTVSSVAAAAATQAHTNMPPLITMNYLIKV